MGRASDARAVILLDHGSRESEANAQLDALAALVAERLPHHRVAVAHMSLAPPSLAHAASECVRAGARRLTIVPCFLAAGRHVQDDLPRLVAELERAHPEARFHLARPLGAHPSVADALADRAREGEPEH